MQNHRYVVGQAVDFVRPSRTSAARGEYKISRLLPAESGQYLYRIKRELERGERVVVEDQLSER